MGFKQAKADKIARVDTKRQTLGLYADLAGAIGEFIWCSHATT